MNGEKVNLLRISVGIGLVSRVRYKNPLRLTIIIKTSIIDQIILMRKSFDLFVIIVISYIIAEY